ncbi:hypothetical protein U0A40_02335, partial [Escherichia coli]|nr:hypothetical protein [Escherichia coli]
ASGSRCRRVCQQARGRARGNEGSAQVKLPDDGGDAGRRGGDAGALKFQGGSVTDGEGDRQDGWSVISRSGATGVGSGEGAAEMPESFVVDAVLPGIRGPGHAADAPGVVVLASLRRGHFFAISFLSFAYKGRTCRMAWFTTAGNASSPDAYHSTS